MERDDKLEIYKPLATMYGTNWTVTNEYAEKHDISLIEPVEDTISKKSDTYITFDNLFD